MNNYFLTMLKLSAKFKALQVTFRLWQENENKVHHQLDGVAVGYSSDPNL